MKSTFDCVVIGAGIAGMTAAIYLKRANVDVVIIDNSAPGGLLNKISTVENYPGFVKITGPELASIIWEQVMNLGIEIRYGKVLKIEDQKVITDMEELTTQRIIIATGRSAKKLGIEGNLKNVSYCAVCDATLYKEKTVAVVGGGNSALEDAIYLASVCKKVYILNRSDQLKADDILVEQANAKENIEIKLNCVINAVKEKDHLLYEINTNQETLALDGLFILIGYEPNTDFLEGIDMEKGYIVVDNQMKTNLDNIYACGDIIKKDVYQLSTAIGEAATVALAVKKSLK